MKLGLKLGSFTAYTSFVYLDSLWHTPHAVALDKVLILIPNYECSLQAGRYGRSKAEAVQDSPSWTSCSWFNRIRNNKKKETPDLTDSGPDDVDAQKRGERARDPHDFECWSSTGRLLVSARR